jgi:hypothetical protein
MSIHIRLLFIFMISVSIMYGQQSTDEEYIDSAIAKNSLAVINTILRNDSLTALDIKSIYHHEIIIGKYIGNMTYQQIVTWPNKPANYESYKRNDSTLYECIKYVQLNKKYFRIVDDKWKGDDNYWEPNRYWIYRIQMKYSDSYEAKEIEYDLDFKEFMREYDIDMESKGLDCDTYITNITTGRSGDFYKEVYSEDEIKTWVPECKEARRKFRIGKKKILEKYQYAPFTKSLQDIDESFIVVYHSIC